WKYLKLKIPLVNITASFDRLNCLGCIEDRTHWSNNFAFLDTNIMFKKVIFA
ncbi:11176_t:CDS:1, partial [Dentiscutata erythropus]